mmetsp:Transcript_15070/g.12785  ORF Transcript_15070/g.12785 Transcript_15070/m.12785 type:complete len:287 (+) Transcript_15070:121-981(+)
MGKRDFNKSAYNRADLDDKVKKEHAITSFENIQKVYHLKRVLGHGHFGTVRLGISIAHKDRKFAIKIVSKEKIKKELHLLKRELVILRKLDHPNLIRFYETYQDPKFFYFVMEYCEGGELFDRLAKFKQIDETEVAKIMRKAFSAVKHIHTIGIVHRDLKPENFMFKSNDPDSELKLIDFGLSKLFGDEPDKKMKSMVGTPLYAAPEVLNGEYDERCDNWSLGVMMYVLLSGNPPFDGDNTQEIFKKIMEGKYSMNGPEFKRVSRQAKDLISKLLIKNPDKRFTAS